MLARTTARLTPTCPRSQPVDLVLISHSHYDHLSLSSTQALWAAHGSTVHFLVPLGLKSWFVSSGVDEARVTEMDWWDEMDVVLPPSSEGAGDGEKLRIACTPCQHSSGRGGGDQNKTLWCSWVLGQPRPSSDASESQPVQDAKDKEREKESLEEVVVGETKEERSKVESLLPDDVLDGFVPQERWKSGQMQNKVYFAGSVHSSLFLYPLASRI